VTPDEYKNTWLPNSFLTETIQVCVVTRDLDRALKEYSGRLGIGPWWCEVFEPPGLTDTKLRGVPTAFTMRLALAWTGAMMWELIEPLGGPSIYKEFLEAHGEGVQHLAVRHQGLSLDACVAAFEARGCPCIMEGAWKGTRFRYFDTEGPAHTIFEIWESPKGAGLPEPRSWYPPRGSGKDSP
jgi:hypothetical protein